MVGTAAVTEVESLAARFGERLVVAIDARDGRVVADGWTTETEVTAVELARRCAAAGVGAPAGDEHAQGRFAGRSGPATSDRGAGGGLPVLAAGGIASLDDLGATSATSAARAPSSAARSGQAVSASPRRCPTA